MAHLVTTRFVAGLDFQRSLRCTFAAPTVQRAGRPQPGLAAFSIRAFSLASRPTATSVTVGLPSWPNSDDGRSNSTPTAQRPPSERLFEDPYASFFAAAGAHAHESTQRFLDLPFFRDGVRLRTRYIDDAVREGLNAGLDQVVLLGAGFDARGLRMAGVDARGASVARFVPRTLYQARVPRGPAVPTPDPFIFVARVGDVGWRTPRRGLRGGARGVDDRAARSSLLPSKEGDGGGLFYPRRCLAFVEIVHGCWLNAACRLAHPDRRHGRFRLDLRAPYEHQFYMADEGARREAPAAVHAVVRHPSLHRTLMPR